MPSSIKAILFDKDGTLLDFERTWAKVNEQGALMAAKGNAGLAGHFLDIAGRDPVSGKTRPGSLFAAGNSQEIAAAWIEAGADFIQADLAGRFDQMCIEGMNAAVPLPGVPHTIKRLHAAGYVLGVASSDSEASIRVFLDKTDLMPLMDFVTGYDSGFGPKPEPGMIHGFAHALGYKPSEIAMIGDNTHDLEMADRAGAGLGIGVLSGTGTRNDLEGLADHILESVADLPGFLGNGN